MRLRFLVATAALLAAACSPAFADELFTLTDGTNTISFTASPAAVAPGFSYSFLLAGIPIDFDGSIMNENVEFFDTTVTPPGGLEIYNPTSGFVFLNQSGAQLFGGTISSPTFSPGGPFALSNAGIGAPPEFSNNFTLNITTPTAPPPVPEPSSFVLLGTGLLGAFGAIRRRFVANAATTLSA